MQAFHGIYAYLSSSFEDRYLVYCVYFYVYLHKKSVPQHALFLFLQHADRVAGYSLHPACKAKAFFGSCLDIHTINGKL